MSRRKMTSSKSRPRSSGASAAYGPAELARTMRCSVEGSRPAAAPRTYASCTSTPAARNSWLFTSFATVPAPAGPTWKTCAAKACSSGSTAAIAASSPPAITLRSPESALTLPPDTGASTKPMPAAPQRSCRRRTRSGELVERSTTNAGGGSAVSTPSTPAIAASTSAGAGSDRNTQSAPTAVSAALATGTAPVTAAIASARRSNTRSSCPAATRWRAIGAPIVPTPTKPIPMVPNLRQLAIDEHMLLTDPDRRARQVDERALVLDGSPPGRRRLRTTRQGAVEPDLGVARVRVGGRAASGAQRGLDRRGEPVHLLVAGDAHGRRQRPDQRSVLDAPVRLGRRLGH